ncbi:MAG: hypothetical protein IJ729_06315 [Alloprevotella sp.]|nr:hypothetical protein [Alloprevotella sp.]
MNMTRYNCAALLLSAAAALFAACTGDDPLVLSQGESPYDPETGLTSFATGFDLPPEAEARLAAAEEAASDTIGLLRRPTPAETAAQAGARTFMAKTYMNSDGTFWWTMNTSKKWGSIVDNIYVNVTTVADAESGNIGEMVVPVWSSIATKQDFAKFKVDRELDEAKYQVFYTGKRGMSIGVDAGGYAEVLVAKNQLQDTPNNAQHLEDDGDCGTAWANKQPEYYHFQLNHKAVYLLFTPYTHRTPQMERCRLIRIDVEDISPTPNQIAGLYDFDFDGLAASPRADENASRKVTLSLGEFGDGMKGWPLDEKIDTILAENGRAEAGLGGDPTDGAYMVIAPGSTDLRITYYVQYFTLQSPWYENFGDDTTEGSWRYQYDWNWKKQAAKSWYIKDTGCLPQKKTYSQYPWELPDPNSEYIGTLEDDISHFGEETGFYTFTREMHFDGGLHPNDYKRIAHRLPIIEADSVYDFCQSYYEWDAAAWFWEGWDWNTTSVGVGMPGINTDFPRTNDEAILTDIEKLVGTPAYQNVGNALDEYYIDRMDMRSMPEGSRTTADMPTADQMSWIIDYAKPHYDPDTKWYMKEFHDGYTLCRGGVWLLKTELMRDYNGQPITSNPDYIAGLANPRYDKTLLRATSSLEGQPAENTRLPYNPAITTNISDAYYRRQSQEYLTWLYQDNETHTQYPYPGNYTDANGYTEYQDDLEYYVRRGSVSGYTLYSPEAEEAITGSVSNADGYFKAYSSWLDLDDGSPMDNLRRYYKRDYLNPSKSAESLRDRNLSDDWGYDATKRPPLAEVGNYYFIPFFGYYETLAPTETDVKPWEEDHLWMKLKLVGVRAHLWSKTPWRRRHFWAKHNGWYGITTSDIRQHFATPKLPKWMTNNAFYFYANEEYVAVSWYGLDADNQNRWGHLAGRRADGSKWFK